MRIAKMYTKGRRARLRSRGLGPLLETRAVTVHQDVRNVIHAGPFCQEAYGRPETAEVLASWRDLTCTCWGNSTPSSDHLDDLGTVAVALAYEAEVEEAERRSRERTPAALEAYHEAAGWDDGHSLLRHPDEAVQEAYSAWQEDLDRRKELLRTRYRTEGLRPYQEQVVLQLAVQDVVAKIEEFYVTPKRPLGERKATRRLLAIWAEDKTRGGRERPLMKLVGHGAAAHRCDVRELGRRTSMWMRDAERLLPKRQAEILAEGWELVVYGSNSGRREKDPNIAPFLLRTENMQVLAVMPRRVRQHLASTGINPVRCTPLPGGSDVHEVVAALWEPGLLLQDGGLERLAEAAETLLS